LLIYIIYIYIFFRSQFEFEHQNFIEGIVGSAYEYLCQFIIKNSMENIKRTQCALNCFSLTNNLSKYYTIIRLIYILLKNEHQFGLNKYNIHFAYKC